MKVSQYVNGLATTMLSATLALVTLTACASAPATPPRSEPQAPTPVPGGEPALPPIPAADGPLRLEVGYPPENATIAVRDSNFIFGSTGSGRTQLTINGAPVQVAPNGGFLAFLPVPPDGVYRLSATRDGETATLERTIGVPPAPGPPTEGARILSPYPTGTWALRVGETFEVGFRGPAGGQAALLLPDGTRIPLVEQGVVAETAVGDEFRTNVPAPQRTSAIVRYSAVIPVTAPFLARDTGLARPRIGTLDAVSPGGGQQPLGATPPAGVIPSRDAVLELIVNNDTARAPLRLNLAVLPADVPRTGIVTAPPDAAHDWTARGRNDISGPFHFFWPPGARLTITGEKDGLYRVRLAGNRHAWVSAGDVRLLPIGAPPAAGIVSAVRFNPEPQWIDLRIPATERLPFHVTEEDDVLHIDVFGATSRVNFFQYGGLDPLITRAEWRQPADSVFRVTVQLSDPVWGYHTFYEPGGALVMRIRRPPPIDPAAPLRGLLIAVDPGHGGEDRATRGPTGLTEADANLYVALKLRDLLTQAGARVMMTRTTDATVPLNDRPRMATDSGAHILVSVHNNAFPDGVNPWQNNGTSAYYYHPHSVELVRLMQQELLRELRLRDIGFGRADLALVRPTWMPAVLTETTFMMIPQQEAALRDPTVQERIARAHVRALEAFLLSRARR